MRAVRQGPGGVGVAAHELAAQLLHVTLPVLQQPAVPGASAHHALRRRDKGGGGRVQRVGGVRAPAHARAHCLPDQAVETALPATSLCWAPTAHKHAARGALTSQKASTLGHTISCSGWLSSTTAAPSRRAAPGMSASQSPCGAGKAHWMLHSPAPTPLLLLRQKAWWGFARLEPAWAHATRRLNRPSFLLHCGALQPAGGPISP